MATVALLDLWKKKSNSLKESFNAYKQGFITHGELDYIVMQNGCLAVDQDQIPWSHVQHLVITNPSSRFQKNEQYPADIFHAYHTLLC